MPTRRLAGLALAAIAIASLPGCSKKSAEHTDIVALAAEAQSGLYVAGTLATLGSFDWDVAPLKTHAEMVLHQTALALKQGRITEQQAKGTAFAIDRAHDLLQRALAACAQDDRTGKCTKDEATARALLDQARAELSNIS